MSLLQVFFLFFPPGGLPCVDSEVECWAYLISNMLRRWSIHLFYSAPSCQLSNVELGHNIKAWGYRDTRRYVIKIQVPNNRPCNVLLFPICGIMRISYYSFINMHHLCDICKFYCNIHWTNPMWFLWFLYWRAFNQIEKTNKQCLVFVNPPGK